MPSSRISETGGALSLRSNASTDLRSSAVVAESRVERDAGLSSIDSGSLAACASMQEIKLGASSHCKVQITLIYINLLASIQAT